MTSQRVQNLTAIIGCFFLSCFNTLKSSNARVLSILPLRPENYGSHESSLGMQINLMSAVWHCDIFGLCLFPQFLLERDGRPSGDDVKSSLRKPICFSGRIASTPLRGRWWFVSSLEATPPCSNMTS